MTTVHYRYRVGHPEYGLSDCFSRLAQAKAYARMLPDHEQYTIFDVMAHRGAPEYWKWYDGDYRPTEWRRDKP